MPESYYCFDNFFHKMTDIESPRKNNDCYFYYYSTCTKGDSCTFRHEPSALGCETMCSFWKEGKCINVHCNFRHMELRKNRKSIPCYWESQPGGCKKPHCPFLHASNKIEKGEASDLQTSENKDGDSINMKKNQVDNFGSPVVDPLVVKIEEESDNESAPSQSPIKSKHQQRVIKVKTLEEIKLERIQAESAAYYSYSEAEDLKSNCEDAESLRNRIMLRLGMQQQKEQIQTTEKCNSNHFQVLSLDEIRKRKQRDGEHVINNQVPAKKQKVVLNNRIRNVDLNQIKIKTLDEIKADRLKRKDEQVIMPQQQEESMEQEILTSESEVSSTSKFDTPIMDEENTTNKMQCVVAPVVREIEKAEHCDAMDVKSTINDDSKLDDFLLEDDDCETSSLCLRAEEDILNDIDNLLNE